MYHTTVSLLLVVLGGAVYVALVLLQRQQVLLCIKTPKRALDCIMLARSCPDVECACFKPIFHALYRDIQWWLDGMRVSTSLCAIE